MLPLRSVGRSNFVMVLRKINYTTLIQRRHILMRTAVLCNEINSGQLSIKKHYIYIYTYILYITEYINIIYIIQYIAQSSLNDTLIQCRRKNN